jgi:ATP-dependent Clp protease ATP-binding subunit ClpA
VKLQAQLEELEQQVEGERASEKPIVTEDDIARRHLACGPASRCRASRRGVERLLEMEQRPQGAKVIGQDEAIEAVSRPSGAPAPA